MGVKEANMIETFSNIICVAAFAGGFALLLVLGEGVFNLAYHFIPWFRDRMDAAFDGDEDTE